LCWYSVLNFVLDSHPRLHSKSTRYRWIQACCIPPSSTTTPSYRWSDASAGPRHGGVQLQALPCPAA
jgi:hypothetical protein